LDLEQFTLLKQRVSYNWPCLARSSRHWIYARSAKKWWRGIVRADSPPNRVQRSMQLKTAEAKEREREREREREKERRHTVFAWVHTLRVKYAENETLAHRDIAARSPFNTVQHV